MIRRRIVPLFLLISLAAVLGVGAKRLAKQSAPSSRGMTLRVRVFERSQPVGEQVFSVFSSGDFRYQVFTPKHVYGALRLHGQGFYIIDDTKQSIRQDTNVNINVPLPSMTAEELRRSPRYVKDDIVLGIPSIMQRQLNESGKVAVEAWYAPDVAGFIPLVEVIYDQDTGEIASRTEMTSVDHHEPSADLLRIPNYRWVQESK